jgi:hypothetical protein
MKILRNKSLFYLLLLLALSGVTLLPFFHTGFFTMHDDTQVARVYEMFLSLKSGMIPVRWVLDLGYGYGYPIFTFYAPFAYYFGALWMFLGFDVLTSTKIMMGVGVILAGVGMYLFAKDVWGEEGGFIAGLFYLFAPYHAVNIYIRGAVAEFWGMAFLPFVFYGLWNTYNTRKWRYLIVGSLAYAGVILSHNLTAMMVTPFLLVVIGGMTIACLLKKDYQTMYKLAGIALSTFYWLPAITEMRYTNVISQISGSGSKFSDHFVCLNQLWNSPWGYAGSGPGCEDGVSFRIGKLHVFFVLLAVVLGGFIYKKNNEKGVVMLGSVLFFFIAVFLTLPQSEFIWRLVSPMSYFQFPWRFLLLVIFFSSFLSGSIIWYTTKLFHKKPIMLFGILAVTVLGVLVLYGKLFSPQTLTTATPASLTDEKVLRYTTSKVSDEYLPPYFQIPKNESDFVLTKAIFLRGAGQIKTTTITPQLQTFVLQTPTTQALLLNTAPFPAWKTILDGQSIIHTNTNKGMLITIPSGEHTVSLVYVATKLEMIGNSVTLTSMLVLLIGIIYLQKKKML